MKKEHKVIVVEWEDSGSNHGWLNEGDEKVSICMCETTGFLVDETKDGIAIAQNTSSSKGYKPYGNVISIPKSAIKKRKVIGKY